MITIGNTTFTSSAEVWDTFTNYQPVDEFLLYGGAGQSVAEKVAGYVASMSDPAAPDDIWREFMTGQSISATEAAAIVAAAMTEYALRDHADTTVLTASAVAERLGVTLRWVTRLAERSHAAGQPIGARLGSGKGTTWIFRASDVAALQALRQPPGRPRTRD